MTSMEQAREKLRLGVVLNTEDMAALLDVKRSTIWRRCEQGRMVPPPIMERPYRFSPLQVQQVIDGAWPKQVSHGRRQFFRRGAQARAAVLKLGA